MARYFLRLALMIFLKIPTVGFFAAVTFIKNVAFRYGLFLYSNFIDMGQGKGGKERKEVRRRKVVYEREVTDL